MRAIDKLDKLPPAAVATLLIEQAQLSTEQARLCLELAAIRTSDSSFAAQVAGLGVVHPQLSEGIAELAAVIDGCRPFATERFQVEADLSIARGLDYYTGTVFETRMAGHESLGSICSGGRYDSLATDGSTTYPGVGISLGLTRLLVPLLARGELTATRSVPSAVLVALASDETRPASEAVADALRAPRDRLRGRRQRPEVRATDPHGRTAGDPVRLVPRPRLGSRGQRHPLRRAGRR